MLQGCPGAQVPWHLPRWLCHFFSPILLQPHLPLPTTHAPIFYRDIESRPSLTLSIPILNAVYYKKAEFMSIENLKTFDPFAEADEDTGETKQSQNYIHIRIQQRNGRKTLTTVQGLPKKFDQKKILKVIKKKFACNGTIVSDTEMGEVIQLQGDQRKDVQEFLTDKKEGLKLDAKTIKVHGF
ncbi:Eukaryotic translation initiation factor SUI1 [Penicillium mononematosum]|uniref:Eukaryotic translation initiation factor SUI1 n=1 Tax=Penicillium mononematosum TaxID=268346 RepID=UPI0025470119|nr:Eukaryotic translation initiation factor SUI1 [Penicillium mononematosum]KAJ6178459.1 Eukaryotic translation initiation factor SUI1 [Penicillium mononematosum]